MTISEIDLTKYIADNETICYACCSADENLLGLTIGYIDDLDEVHANKVIVLENKPENMLMIDFKVIAVDSSIFDCYPKACNDYLIEYKGNDEPVLLFLTDGQFLEYDLGL
jgi:hypothetical protein